VCVEGNVRGIYVCVPTTAPVSACVAACSSTPPCFVTPSRTVPKSATFALPSESSSTLAVLRSLRREETKAGRNASEKTIPALLASCYPMLRDTY
jgi:hypothetical protein